jgi:ABC-type branched-subunit amino acid transport system ATPase component
MALVMEVCDRVHVLDLGRVIAVGDCAEVQSDPAVLEAYLGTSAAPSDLAVGAPDGVAP